MQDTASQTETPVSIGQIIEETARFITTNPIAIIALAFLAVCGIFLSIVFYFKSKKDRRPYYAVSSIQLVRLNSQSLPKISVSFDGKETPRITISSVAFWNAGRETIRRSDIASTDRLRIICNKDDDEILDIQIKSVLKSSICPVATIAEGRKSAEFSFEYLDRYDGFVFQVIHTGSGSSAISIAGKILGCESIRELWKPSVRLQKSTLRAMRITDRIIRNPWLAVLASFCSIGFIIGMAYLAPGRKATSMEVVVLLSIISIPYIAVICMSFLRQVPRTLASFYDGFEPYE